MNFSKKTFVAALACLALSVTACGDNEEPKQEDKPQTVTTENTKELCSDTKDNDGNGKVDCADSGCAEFAFCQDPEEGKENTLAACQDQDDNDGDGLVDCDDEECQAFSLCQKAEEGKENTLIACQDGEDNDGDGKKDCEDPDCQAFSACAKNDKTGENTVETCIDGEDNDRDGKIDCADEGCRIFAFCAGYTDPEENNENSIKACTDGKDNDDDDLVDCADEDCKVFAICASEIGILEDSRELCSDGIDNDLNGKKDCEEESCALYCQDGGAFGENTYEYCSDNFDNDGDGKADCEDPECAIFDICSEPNATDQCPDDHFKRNQNDGCPCGQTKVSGDCYKNIETPEDLSKLDDKYDNFIIKAPLRLPENFKRIQYFYGTLNGGNKRITGIINQTNGCGLFGQIGNGDANSIVVSDIDLAITLNCQLVPNDNDDYVGALAGKLVGTANNITGSSKVFIVKEQPSGSGSLDITANRKDYFGALFGTADNLYNVNITGNLSVDFYTYDKVTQNNYRSLYIGGLVGYLNQNIANSHNNIYMTLNLYPSYSVTTYHMWAQRYVGGLIGGTSSNSLVTNSSSSGNIKVILSSRAYVDYIGGLIGNAGTYTSISNCKFTGNIDVPVYRDRENSGIFAVGGLCGVASFLTDSYVKANMKVAADYVGGLVGALRPQDTTNTYIGYMVNNFADIDIQLLATGSTSYFGGLTSGIHLDKGTHYLINNSVRIPKSKIGYVNSSIYALVSEASDNTTWVANNFVYFDAKNTTLASTEITKASYVYETYWNSDMVASHNKITWMDSTAESYSINLDGVPVLDNGSSVLSRLRYNSGHDGGVVSTRIPAEFTNASYDNWVYYTDENGLKIPVPESAYKLINNIW